MAILKAAQFLLSGGIFKSLTKIYCTSVLGHKSWEFFIEILGHSKITLSLVPGRGDFVGNYVADELARAGMDFATFDIPAL